MENIALDKTQRSDAELVELTRQGDHDAFGLLIQRHWRKCVDLGCFFLRNRGDAEDQVQNAAMKAFEHLDQYQGDAEFSTWLGRIVANECLMLMRSQRKVRFVYLDEAPPETKAAPLQLPGTEPDPEGALGYAQLTEVLQSEVRRIPPLMRNVTLLRDIQGLPMRHVADRLGITVSAAKSRLVRARAELRQRMIRHYSGMSTLSPLARTAAPLSRVGRHCAMQVTR
jgi:RNA polymerase sigma-70 factor (ECF subfamily)